MRLIIPVIPGYSGMLMDLLSLLSQTRLKPGGGY